MLAGVFKSKTLMILDNSSHQGPRAEVSADRVLERGMSSSSVRDSKAPPTAAERRPNRRRRGTVTRSNLARPTLHQVDEPPEQIARVVGARRRLGVILNRERRLPLHHEPLARLVVQIHVRDLRPPP